MSTRRALAFSFLDRYAGLTLSIVSSMFIARLLTPEEIGVFSVTMVLLAFVTALRDFGAGQYLVQEKELTVERIRATWTVLLFTGGFFAIVVLCAARPVASFYNDPRMVDIMLVIAVNFAINPFGSLTYAWLMREMRFDALAMMRFASGLAGATTSVLLAWKGFGPMSLAIGSLMSTIANALLAARFRPPQFPWLPGGREWRRVISFGSKISVNSLLNSLAGGAPELLLGKLQGLAFAAQFSRAAGLASLFQKMILDAVQSVALPMFSKEIRENGNFNGSFVLAMSYVTAFGWSFFLGLALLADPVIRLLYGGQWGAAVEPTRIVSIAFLIGLPAAMCGPALLAMGAVDKILHVTLATLVIHIAAVMLGAVHGLVAVAFGFAVSYVFGVSIWLTTTHAVLGFHWRAFGTALLKSAAVACMTALAPTLAVVIFGWHPEHVWAPLLLSVVLGPVLFICSIVLTNHPLSRELLRMREKIGIR